MADLLPESIKAGPDSVLDDSGAASRPGFFRATGRGALLGMRLAAWVFGVIAGVVVILSLLLTAFAAGSGRGWALSSYPFLAVRFFLAGVISGALIGAPVVATARMIGGLFRLARPRARATLWLNRPIRLARRSRSSEHITVELPRSWTLPWPWLVALPLMLLLAIAYGIGAGVGWWVDHRLAEATRAADLDDPAWRIDDLMAARESVPDEGNSALVVASVVTGLPEKWPWPSGPAGDTLGAAYDRLGKTPDNVLLDQATVDRLRAELTERAGAVEAARTLVDYRRGRHELDLGSTLLDTPLPETQASRLAARLLHVDATLRAHDGDPDGALESCRAILGVSRSIGDEPFVISQLVRIAEGEQALKAARRVLGQGEPSDEALARFQALVLDELSRPLMLHGLKGERATLLELIRRIRDGELPISELSSDVRPFDPGGSLTEISPWGRLMFDNQRAVGLEWTNRMVAIVRRFEPERPALVEALQLEIDQARNSPLLVFTSSLPLLYMAGFPAAIRAEARYHAQLGALAILLAAERHRRKVGDWPESIVAIDPSLRPVVPPDPFGGQTFRMERKDGQLLIYSVGPNGRDEHGVVDPKGWMKSAPDDYGTGAWDAARRRAH